MVESTRFSDFIETARARLDLIRQCLLRHEKNPDDREFLNDYYRSVRALKDASLPLGLGRFSELCFHLESILTVIRRNRLPIGQETISLLRETRDRLSKLLHEIETTRKERATVKDLLKRIRNLEQSVAAEESMEQAPEIEILEPGDEPPETHPDSSLLPEEIIKEEYDQELFQIFMEQMQENLSLLRSLTPFFANQDNQAKCAALCSELVGRLQSSANYMGYEGLADFYLQWIAELEMAGVDLAMGISTSFTFMDSYLKRITSLFPRIEDTPAPADKVNRIWLEFSTPPPPARKPSRPSAAAESEDDSLKDLFHDIKDADPDFFAPDPEPVAALAGAEPQTDDPVTPAPGPVPGPRPLAAPPVEIDGTFLEEERQSDAFDEELFQIFIQQLRENITKIRALTDGFAQEANKGAVIDRCSALVGNLQTSANYMGYTQLAEYHLQWIAELELAGVDLAIGNSVDLGFMDEKIQKISEIFPEIETISAAPADFSVFDREPSSIGTTADTRGEDSPAEEQVNEPRGDQDEFLFDLFDDEEDDSFELDPEPVAALAGDVVTADLEDLSGEPVEDAGDEHALGKEKAGQTVELERLFAETDPDASPSAGTPPVPEKLLQKLSDALNSIDDEESFQEPAGTSEPVDSQNDSDLFDKLLSAIDLSAGPRDDPTSAIDQIIEEILTGEQRSDTTPPELPTPEIRRSLGPDAERIDELVGKIGELATGRASLARLHAEMNSLHHTLLNQDGVDSRKLAPFRELASRLGSTNKALGRLFGEIQEGILKVKMTPVARLFDLYSEFVTRLAREAGKKITFTTNGRETEVDLCSIEDVASCLLILIRNAVEHGIEPPQERGQAGKEPIGTICLSAFQEFNHIVFEVTDDGRGIDPKKVKSAALASGLFSGDDLYNMADHDLTRLVMTPGFTTRTGKKDVERDPGLDTLKETVERLSGTVSITSTIGTGTTIQIRLPFTPPVFQALRLRDGDDTYALPLVDIEELLRVSRDDIEKRDGIETMAFRGEQIPVRALSELVNDGVPAPVREERFYVAVVSADSKKVGLSMDEALGLEDVSIRPLAGFLREECGFSAAAVKGEGEILFIPAIRELVEKVLP